MHAAGPLLGSAVFVGREKSWCSKLASGKHSRSYEALSSRRAKKYQEQGLGDKNLTEEDYRQYLLEEYTFLKRPVWVLDQQIFVGNAKTTTEAAKAALHAGWMIVEFIFC